MPATLASTTPGLRLLDTNYQNQVASGLIPDLFSRFVPTQAQPANPGFGALGGSFGPPAQPQEPSSGSGGGGGGGNAGAPGAPQLAQAALLLQMLQGGPGGFLGRLGVGNGMQGLGAQQGAFQGLQGDPAIAALFQQGNYFKPSPFAAGLQFGQSPQDFRGMYGGGPARGAQQGMGLAPDIFQQAIAALQLLLNPQQQQNA